MSEKKDTAERSKIDWLAVLPAFPASQRDKPGPNMATSKGGRSIVSLRRMGDMATSGARSDDVSSEEEGISDPQIKAAQSVSTASSLQSTAQSA